MTFLDQGFSLSSYVWDLGRGLFALFGLGCALYLLARARGRQLRLGERGPLELVQRVSLGSRRMLYVVRVEGRTLIVGASDEGPITLLAELGAMRSPSDAGAPGKESGP